MDKCLADVAEGLLSLIGRPPGVSWSPHQSKLSPQARILVRGLSEGEALLLREECMAYRLYVRYHNYDSSDWDCVIGW